MKLTSTLLFNRSAPGSPTHLDLNFKTESGMFVQGLSLALDGSSGGLSVAATNNADAANSLAQTTLPSASQRLVQLSNDIRLIQSAPGSPQGTDKD